MQEQRATEESVHALEPNVVFNEDLSDISRLPNKSALAQNRPHIGKPRQTLPAQVAVSQFDPMAFVDALDQGCHFRDANAFGNLLCDDSHNGKTGKNTSGINVRVAT